MLRRLSRGAERLFAVSAFALLALVAVGLFWARAHRQRVASTSAAGYHEAKAGDVVAWCVDHLAAGVSYVDGKAGQTISWINEPVVPMTSPPKAGHCEAMTARVVERRAAGPVLEYLGRP